MSRPVYPDRVQKRLSDLVREFTAHKLTASPGQRGAVQKYLCLAWKEQALRHLCLGFLFGAGGPIETAALTDAQVMALKRWVNASTTSTDGHVFEPDKDWPQEAEWVAWAARQWQASLANAGADLVGEAIKQGGVVTEVGEDPDYVSESSFEFENW